MSGLRLRAHPSPEATAARAELRLLCNHWKYMLKDTRGNFFEDDDYDQIKKAVEQTLDWLYKNQLASKDEFESKQKEFEGVVDPIFYKDYRERAAEQLAAGGLTEEDR